MTRTVEAVLRRPVGTLSVCFAVVIAGIAAIASSTISLLPPIDVPVIIVTARYDGLPAEEMRELVTLPLERGVSAVTGFREIESTTRTGVVSVKLTFDWDVRSADAASRTREAVDTLYPALPNAVPRPSVRRADPSARPAARLALYPTGVSPARARRLAEREVRALLQQRSGVGTVVVSGGEVEEVHVTVDQTRAHELGVDITSIRSTLVEGNSEYAGGSLYHGDLELLVTTDARVASAAELETLFVVPHERDGSSHPPIPLSSLAAVTRGYAPRSSVFQVDGREAVGMAVYALSDASPAAVADRVRESVPELERSFGSAIDVELVADQGGPIRTALWEVISAAALGTAAAFLVLLLSLRNVRAALVVALAIPLSASFAFTIMAPLGVTLNLMSLSGLAIGIGMVVDNSIVVVENLHERAVAGELDAATVSCSVAEVSGATLSGTVTTVAVFLPLYAFPGVTGLLYRDLATSFIAALAAGYLVSITVTPLLAWRLAGAQPAGAAHPHAGTPHARAGTPHARAGTRGNPRARIGGPLYRRLLKCTLRNPLITIGFTVLAAACGVLLLTRLEIELTEQTDEGEISVSLEFPAEYSVEAAAKQSAYISGALRALPAVRSVITRVGSEPGDPWFLADPFRRPNSSELHLLLRRGVSAHRLLEELRESVTISTATMRAGLPENAISTLLRSDRSAGLAIFADTPERAAARAREVAAGLRAATPESNSLALAPVERRPGIFATPNREILDGRHISLTEASILLRSAVEGAKAGTLLRGGEEIDIRLRYGRITGIEDLERILLAGAVPFAEALHIEEREGAAVLSRRNRHDVVYITGNIRVPASLVADTPWIEDATGLAMTAQIRSLLPMFSLALLTMATILVLQFERIWKAALVLSVLPLAIVGAALAVHLTGRSFTMQSALGSLVLTGIVVNSAIMLVETWRSEEPRPARRRDAADSWPRGSRRRHSHAAGNAAISGRSNLSGMTARHGIRRHAALRRAVIRGSLRRLRPILMTTATTAAAMVPLMIDPGVRSHQSGLATAIVGGLVAGTAVSVLVLPCVYLITARYTDSGADRRE